jgi:hypothetical protein
MPLFDSNCGHYPDSFPNIVRSPLVTEDEFDDSVEPNDLDDSAPPSTYRYLSELLSELDPNADSYSSLDADELVDSGRLFPEDFPVSSFPYDQDLMDHYSQVEDSVEVPDF